VQSVPFEIPRAHRAQWLAELSDVLAEAQQLLFELDLTARHPVVGELFHSIEAARLEVRLLQVSRTADRGPENGPEWIELAPWRAARHEAC
jgi:hypothetical protein